MYQHTEGREDLLSLVDFRGFGEKGNHDSGGLATYLLDSIIAVLINYVIAVIYGNKLSVTKGLNQVIVLVDMI